MSCVFQAQLDEKSREVTALRESLSDVMREKERLEKVKARCFKIYVFFFLHYLHISDGDPGVLASIGDTT